MSKISQIKNNWQNKIDNLDIDCILTYVINKPRSFFYTHPEYECTPAQTKKINVLMRRRNHGEPLAYIVGHKEFFEFDFIVNKHTLIPRPETEMLVEEVLKNKNIKTIADIGTGSGCIAIALAKNHPEMKIYASDISAEALKVARRNAKRHQVKVIFKKGNLLLPYQKISLDAVVCNPPYVPNKVKKSKTPETRGLKFEPARALYAGADGLDIYKLFFQQLKKMPHCPRYIYFEIGYDQAKKITALAKKSFPQSFIETKTDLAGRDRLVIIKTH